jgi:hypothetical protein
LFVLRWHPTMAMFLFKLDKLFILLVPAVIFPSEPDFVQNSHSTKSTKSKFVIVMKFPLRINPLPY